MINNSTVQRGDSKKNQLSSKSAPTISIKFKINFITVLSNVYVLIYIYILIIHIY